MLEGASADISVALLFGELDLIDARPEYEIYRPRVPMIFSPPRRWRAKDAAWLGFPLAVFLAQ